MRAILLGTAAAIVAMLLISRPARAEPPVLVTAAWARATAPGQDVGAVYLSIESRTGDKLTGVDSPDAGMTMLHRTTHQGSMSGMADIDTLALPPGQTVKLVPLGTHVMLMGLKHPLVAGGHVKIDLIFEHAGRVQAIVRIFPIGAAGP